MPLLVIELRSLLIWVALVTAGRHVRIERERVLGVPKRENKPLEDVNWSVRSFLMLKSIAALGLG